MIAKLAWKNIWFKPLNTILSIILLTTSVSIITLLILVNKQFEEKYSSNLDGVDLVLGAQGSPLQLVLSSVYHVDDPTGNISYDSVKVWMQHPFVKKAIPMAFGDNYLGYKILGTTQDYLEKYKVKYKEGNVFKENFEVVLGSDVAEKTGLKLGDKFKGIHGSAEEGEIHEHEEYTVVGIAQRNGKVTDNLIVCNIPSVWQMHHLGHEHEEDESRHIHDENCSHEHDDESLTMEEKGMEITSVLLEFKNKNAIFMWPNRIAQNTKMQAVMPAVQMNRLFEMFGVGIQALQFLALGIMLISGISIFIALYNTLKERKVEFALMRVNGASRMQLLIVVLLESLLLCCVGYLFGMLFGRFGLIGLSQLSQEDFKFGFNPFEIIWDKEIFVLILTIFVGVVAALIPAIKAYTLNISKTLANGK